MLDLKPDLLDLKIYLLDQKTKTINKGKHTQSIPNPKTYTGDTYTYDVVKQVWDRK